MNRDEITSMARKAGFVVDEADFITAPKSGRIGFGLELERFAAFVATERDKEIERLKAEIKRLSQVWVITENDIYGYAPEPHADWYAFFGDMIEKRIITGLRISAIKEGPFDSDWLETAYLRVCAGENEAEVLADYGWGRRDEALRRENERLQADAESWRKTLGAAIALGEKNMDEIERLQEENERFAEALHHISLCSQNSMSSKEECGRIARAALRREEI